MMSMFQLSHHEQVRVGVVGNISACHADAPGSIPGHGVSNFFFSSARVFAQLIAGMNFDTVIFFSQLYNFFCPKP